MQFIDTQLSEMLNIMEYGSIDADHKVTNQIKICATQTFGALSHTHQHQCTISAIFKCVLFIESMNFPQPMSIFSRSKAEQKKEEIIARKKGQPQ